MTTVVGKKQPVRGQAFRAPNGEYVSYLCTDDDTLYRPGGEKSYLGCDLKSLN